MKVKSIQEDEAPCLWDDSFTIWYKPNCDVNESMMVMNFSSTMLWFSFFLYLRIVGALSKQIFAQSQQKRLKHFVVNYNIFHTFLILQLFARNNGCKKIWHAFSKKSIYVLFIRWSISNKMMTKAWRQLPRSRLFKKGKWMKSQHFLKGDGGAHLKR